jgi:hypothetical protein
MDDDIEAYLKKCQICQQYSDKNGPLPQPGQDVQLPTRPNQRVHVDLFGPLKNTDKDKEHILVITDAFTKFVQLVPIPNKESSTTADAILDGWIYKFGVMETIVSDGGLEFCNSLQTKIWEKLNINHTTTSPYWPRTNGQAETFNKTMAHYLRTTLAESKKTTLEWKLFLGPLMFSYNTAANRAIKISPFRALLGYDDRAPLWPTMDILLEKDYQDVKLPADVDYIHRWSRHQEEVRQTVHQNNQHDQQLRGAARDKKEEGKSAYHDFTANQEVWLRINEPGGLNPKLGPKWEQGQIVRRRDATSFIVRRLDRKGKKHITVNANYMKPRVRAETAPADADPDEVLDGLAEAWAYHTQARPQWIENNINKEASTLSDMLLWRNRLQVMKTQPFTLERYYRDFQPPHAPPPPPPGFGWQGPGAGIGIGIPQGPGGPPGPGGGGGPRGAQQLRDGRIRLQPVPVPVGLQDGQQQRPQQHPQAQQLHDGRLRLRHVATPQRVWHGPRTPPPARQQEEPDDYWGFEGRMADGDFDPVQDFDPDQADRHWDPDQEQEHLDLETELRQAEPEGATGGDRQTSQASGRTLPTMAGCQ